MVNSAGIEDHNGENAQLLADGYKTIDRRIVYPELYKIVDDAAAKNVSLRILDIGSGSGDDAMLMAKLGHEVVGVEPSDLRKIAMRDNAHANIDYRAGQLPELNAVQSNEKFDVVMMSTVWHYIDPAERVASLLKIAEVLKPDGKLVVSYPSPPSRLHQYEVTPESLGADIEIANRQLPKSKKLSISGEPVIMPDLRRRKGLNGSDINFYTFAIETGHAQSLGARDGWLRK